ncbi:type IV secretion system protein [Phenylobacterium sp. J367]|uniref:type IV secretion system protein n=1 Tax=Phenylobacterium sp. J367 TaxID=2898435 RepID=UPI002151505D|nr:type IV secretion system protein [Phenylobacterium sp. J367]MCR5879666.1 type IV secretion system protein [Phenylobacterium sp. J367]
MAGELRIFSPAYAYVDGKLDAFLDQGVSNAAGQVAGPVRAALVLYVLLYGFAILRGAIAEPFMDFAIRSVKLGLVVMLATTAAYGPWVAQPLFHVLPDTLAQAIGGGSAGDAGQAFDQFFNRAAYLGEKIAREADLTDWLPLLLSGAVWVCGALAAALGFGIVTLAKVALAFLVALGPIFIACALFEATRRYFFGWLGQAVNYLVLFALILSVFQMVLAIVAEQWVAIEGDDPMAGGLMFVALCLLGAIFFLQVPAIAAGIAGGASVGLADFANTARLGRPAARPASSSDGSRGFTAPEGGSIRQVRTTR